MAVLLARIGTPSQPSEIAHALKALGQDMLEGAVDKTLSQQAHRPGIATAAAAVVRADQPESRADSPSHWSCNSIRDGPRS